MSQECDAVAPKIPTTSETAHELDRPRATGWEQLTAWDAAQVVIETRLVVDGALGTVQAVFEVTTFYGDETIALEAQTGLRFPQDLPVALLWFEERTQHYSNRVSPF